MVIECRTDVRSLHDYFVLSKFNNQKLLLRLAFSDTLICPQKYVLISKRVECVSLDLDSVKYSLETLKLGQALSNGWFGGLLFVR